MTPRVVAVVGPTAAGKSAVGIAVAQRLGGEVVNADSMQLYEGMDIGTAKLTVDERAGVPHHLLDIWPVTHPASVAEYQRRARGIVDSLLDRGVVPVIVGGSGLYVRAVIDRLEFPGTDADLRASLEAELTAVGPQALHARLAELDPVAATSILPSNGRRIVRALEVIAMTGSFTATLPDADPVYDVVQIGVDRPAEELDRRIDERVQLMFDGGLVEEVRGLERAGIRAGRTASRALGYQQVLAMLDGLSTEPEARAETARATRRFARRQRSWFRRDHRVQWLSADERIVDTAVRLIDSTAEQK